LTGRTNREYQVGKFPKGKFGQTPYKYRRPFWLPASNYYVLTVSITIALFFIISGILFEEETDAPWITSGILSSFVFISAVILREVVLRKARMRYLMTERRLDANIKNLSVPVKTNANSNKLSLEKNSSIIQQIREKSAAAQNSGKLYEGHYDVFQLCDEYLLLNKQQIETVGVGSPRLAALRRGREIVEELHYFHLLSWAQNKTRLLTQESKIRATISEKLESAQRALAALNSALEFYPHDRQLLESETILKEFIISIKVSDSVEQAERSAFKGNYKRAINHYRDALFFIARESLSSPELEVTVEKINAEIENLHRISSNKGAEDITIKNF